MTVQPMQLPVVYLRPSELFFSDPGVVRPIRLVTVLGSCVSVTLHAPRYGMAAMCHALMPRCPRPSCPKGCGDAHRYVDCAVAAMTDRFRSGGLRPRDVTVKLFGGADMFQTGIAPDSAGSAAVGWQNVAAAREALAAAGFRISVSDVGGPAGRKLFFFPHNGKVWVKRLNLRLGKAG